MYPASFFENVVSRQVRCTLCPHRCVLLPGQSGLCRTRMNRAGKLYTQSYGILSSIASDPIEKKPLYHFHPGKPVLSIGSFGCNMTCDFCQNCSISQVDGSVFGQYPVRDPEDMVDKALLMKNNIGLAYTYNEPTIYYEYMIECAALIRDRGLSNVMVTNGYINKEPLDALLPYIDAFNIDLKSFRQEFYRERSAAHLRPVLETIARVAGSDRHLELTFLIIPDQNDNHREWSDMIRWIEQTCGPDAILHVSKFFPRHRLRTSPTPAATLERFMDMARERLSFVYPGNMPQMDNHTRCPGCGTLLIKRDMYDTMLMDIGRDGLCDHCGRSIPGIFQSDMP